VKSKIISNLTPQYQGNR